MELFWTILRPLTSRKFRPLSPSKLTVTMPARWVGKVRSLSRSKCDRLPTLLARELTVSWTLTERSLRWRCSNRGVTVELLMEPAHPTLPRPQIWTLSVSQWPSQWYPTRIHRDQPTVYVKSTTISSTATISLAVTRNKLNRSICPIEQSISNSKDQ